MIPFYYFNKIEDIIRKMKYYLKILKMSDNFCIKIC